MPKVRFKKKPQINTGTNNYRATANQLERPDHNRAQNPINRAVSTQNTAKAPYNFVPLNKLIVEADPLPDQDKFYSINDKRYTGYIDCNIKTLTPTYIRGCLTEEEIKTGTELRTKSVFFSPAGKVRIPGSSIRGMIRTLVEIVTWSRFGFYEDKHLYYRSFADQSSLKGEYNKYMNPEDKSVNSLYKKSAGYLKKEGYKYFIYPAQEIQYDRIIEAEARYLLETINKQYSEFNYYKLSDGKHLIVSGRMPRKKDWIINKINTGEKIEILEKDIFNYQNDESRDRKKLYDLLDKCKDGSEVPCFYVVWKDNDGEDRISFGHTGLFRIAYEKSIKDHLPPEHNKQKNDNGLSMDFARSIFGYTSNKKDDTSAGRIFVEDAQLIHPDVDPLMEESIPITLLGPKPTSPQLYLEQDTTDIKKLKHYNSDTLIRGNKFYPHKSGKNWNKTDFNENIDTKIKPVKPNTEFITRIRFDNLSENELGALLFVLKLPVGCAHKIGMGKPIGLGSIEIKPELFITDRNKRYGTLINNNRWELGLIPCSNEEMDTKISIFANYILTKMSPEVRGNASNIWETFRLKQLKLLLNIEYGRKLEEKGLSEYMELKQFRNREVLPIPENIAVGNNV